jgi:molecular chaperone GrpE (heat shock protein)
MKKILVGASMVALSLFLSSAHAPLVQASVDVAPAGELKKGPSSIASEVKNIQTRVLMASGKFHGRLTNALRTELLDIKANIKRLLLQSDVHDSQKHDLRIELEDVNDMLG